MKNYPLSLVFYVYHVRLFPFWKWATNEQPYQYSTLWNWNTLLWVRFCVYTDQDPNTIYIYANYSMTFELMTLSVNHEPKIEKPFLSYTILSGLYLMFLQNSPFTPLFIQNKHHTMKSFPPLQMYHHACKPSSQDSCSWSAWAIWVWGYLAYRGTANLKNPKRNQWQGI